MVDMKTFTVFVSLIGLAFGGLLLGGWANLNDNDPSVPVLVRLAKEEYISRSNGDDADVEVISKESQLVNGINYRLVIKFTPSGCQRGPCPDYESCVVRFFRPISGAYSLNSMNCSSHKFKRNINHNENMIPGGEIMVDTNSKGIQDAANFAVAEINAQSNSMYRRMLLDISHVKKQTVAGTKYKMVIVMAYSQCRNTPEKAGVSSDECPANSETSHECSVEVLDQVWMPERFTLLSFKCTPAPKTKKDNRTQMPGGKPVLGGDGHDVGHYGDFLSFLKTYNKSYANDAEHQKRFGIFRENMAKAMQLQEHDTGDARYGASPFADLTAEEFKKNYLTPHWDLSYDPSLIPAKIPSGSPPDAFDWRDHNAVSPVKNQGSCGSCWAFSTTGNIEGQWAIHKSTLLSLSEQELVDCDKLDDGCEGGLPSNAYKEIIRLGGLETESDYPYDAEDDKCSFNKSEARVQINGAVNISSNEADMAAWLAQNGPISIGINAMAMQFYMGGVSHPWSIFCNPSELDHGVLIVGYGTKKGYFSDTPYWIIKNSWGPSWGEKGYYLVYRGAGVCGLNRMATSAVVN